MIDREAFARAKEEAYARAAALARRAGDPGTAARTASAARR